jgi:ABC-type transport system involved in cytochrome c biogenesis permease subunit
MEKFLGIALGLLLILILSIAIGLIPAALFFLAWKEIAVPLFNAPSFTFFQCWLMTACVSALFNFLPKSK